MDIKVYANKEVRAGLEAKGIQLEQVKDGLRSTLRVMAGLESTAVTTDPTTDLDLENRVETLEDIIESIQLKIGEWDQ